MSRVEQSCDWCGNPGHARGDHPLPKDHPHFDPDLDDNALMLVALDDFTDFLSREKAPRPTTTRRPTP